MKKTKIKKKEVTNGPFLTHTFTLSTPNAVESCPYSRLVIMCTKSIPAISFYSDYFKLFSSFVLTFEKKKK